MPQPHRIRKRRKANKQKARQNQTIESQRDKLAEYNMHMKILGKRNSYSKTDPDATFMHMKERPYGGTGN